MTWDHYWRAMWIACSSIEDVKVIDDRRMVRGTVTHGEYFQDHGDSYATRGISESRDVETAVFRLIAVPMARVAERACRPCQRATPFMTPGDLGLGTRNVHSWWHGRPACLPDEIPRPGGFPREESFTIDSGSAGFTWRVGGPASDNWPRSNGWFVPLTQADFEAIRAAALAFYTVPPEDDAEVARLVERIMAAVVDQTPEPTPVPTPSVPSSSAAQAPDVSSPSVPRICVEVRRRGGRRWDLSVTASTGLADLRQESEHRGTYLYSFLPTSDAWTITVQHTEDGSTIEVETITATGSTSRWV